MRMMQEFILWSNCTSNCDFCWQWKKNDQLTFLSEPDMINCLKEVVSKLDNIGFNDDVLIVGGEILNSFYPSVDIELRKLFDKCLELVKSKTIRYFYINTNLIYKDKSNLVYLLDKFNGYEERLKFTTSFDIYGRFCNDKAKELFLDNLAYIHENYPKVNIVVNSIITKQLINSDFNFDEFKEKYGLKYINFIPYIPVDDDRTMDVTFRDIVKVLNYNEKKNKGFIDFYINDLDLHQNKVLYEYNKDKGFIECTSKYLPCGHNANFKRVLGNNECYICKLKDIFR